MLRMNLRAAREGAADEAERRPDHSSRPMAIIQAQPCARPDQAFCEGMLREGMRG